MRLEYGYNHLRGHNFIREFVHEGQYLLNGGRRQAHRKTNFVEPANLDEFLRIVHVHKQHKTIELYQTIRLRLGHYVLHRGLKKGIEHRFAHSQLLRYTKKKIILRFLDGIVYPSEGNHFRQDAKFFLFRIHGTGVTGL